MHKTFTFHMKAIFLMVCMLVIPSLAMADKQMWVGTMARRTP